MVIRQKPPPEKPAEPNARAPRISIEYIAMELLRPDGRNARAHSKKQIRQIADSMRMFGNNVPIIADQNFKIICGHARELAGRLLGLTEMPVIRLEHLTEAQLRAFQIADNRLAENSTWDLKLLGEAFRDIELLDLDLDLITGFETAEIDLAISGLNDDSDEADPDDAPAPTGPPVTRPGDLWEILGHRICCGDALQEASYIAVMGDERAAVTVADIPYNIPIQGNAAGFGKIKYAEFAMASGNLDEVQFTEFAGTGHRHIATWSADGAVAYVFIGWQHAFEAMVAGRRAFAELRALCVWTKPTGGQGSFYRSQHELVLVWKAKPGKPRNNIQLGRFGRSRSNVWAYDRPNRPGDEDRSPMEDHPTPKPVALVADAILDCTARGDIVLDPFLGGGATLMAAERTGRRCRAIEIEPKFVDSAIRRLRRLTGEDARRVSDGRSFADLEKEAGDEQD